jgi:hypothetical protein
VAMKGNCITCKKSTSKFMSVVYYERYEKKEIIEHICGNCASGCKYPTLARLKRLLGMFN